MYLLLSGSPPFYSDNQAEVFMQIMEGNVRFEDKIWGTISE
jgi:hypothetical protein